MDPNLDSNSITRPETFSEELIFGSIGRNVENLDKVKEI